MNRKQLYEKNAYKWDIWWATDNDDDIFNEYVEKNGSATGFSEYFNELYPDQNTAFPNVHKIVAYVSDIMKQEGYSQDEIDQYVAEIKCHDYNYARKYSAEIIQKIND